MNMKYTATIVAPTIHEASEAIKYLGWTIDQMQPIDEEIYKALLEIDKASEAELNASGEITREYGNVAITISFIG